MKPILRQAIYLIDLPPAAGAVLSHDASKELRPDRIPLIRNARLLQYATAGVDQLTLPPGRDIALLPRGKTIKNLYLLYQSNWQRDGPVVIVRRETTVKLPVAVCRDQIRSELAEAIAEIVAIIVPRSR